MVTPKPPIDAVLFDIGGVFIDWDPEHLYKKLIPDADERRHFLTEVCSPEWHSQHDRGRDTAESCRELAERYPEHAGLIAAWSERNEEMVAGILADSIKVLEELRARGVACYVISNHEREAWERRRARYDFLDAFDGYVLSYEEGILKPDPEIFRRALTRFGLTPATTLFVDDRDENIDVARSLGMQTLRFTTAPALREALVSCDLLMPVSG